MVKWLKKLFGIADQALTPVLIDEHAIEETVDAELESLDKLVKEIIEENKKNPKLIQTEFSNIIKRCVWCGEERQSAIEFCDSCGGISHRLIGFVYDRYSNGAFGNRRLLKVVKKDGVYHYYEKGEISEEEYRNTISR